MQSYEKPAPSTSSKSSWQARSQTLAAVRRFFEGRGFAEVDTPIAIMANAPELHIEPVPVSFAHPDGQSIQRFLHTSPELAMKRLLAGGMDRIYQLCHVFRDKEWTREHRPEFMLLEWYRTADDQEWLFKDCQDLIVEVATAVRGAPTLLHGQTRITLEPPFPRYTVDELFDEHCGFHVSTLTDRNELRKCAQQALGRGLQPLPYDDLFNLLWLEKIAPVLDARLEPYFVYAYPAPLASLARLAPDNPAVAQRVELYAGPVELANGFVELTDASEQRQRFTRDEAERRARGLRAQPTDEAFLDAVGRMPPAVGMALGFERLLMLLTGAQDISEVLYT